MKLPTFIRRRKPPVSTPATTPRLALIIGSTRPQHFADKPTEWLLEQAAKREDLTLDRLDLRDFDLPFFAEAGSNLHVPSVDPKVLAWQDAIRPYDGYIFIVAEYNHSVTAALKNALDQAYVEWVRKPFSALGYGSTGGARAIEHLRGIGVELQMVPLQVRGPHRRQRSVHGPPLRRQSGDQRHRSRDQPVCGRDVRRPGLVGQRAANGSRGCLSNGNLHRGPGSEPVAIRIEDKGLSGMTLADRTIAVLRDLREELAVLVPTFSDEQLTAASGGASDWTTAQAAAIDTPAVVDVHGYGLTIADTVTLSPELDGATAAFAGPKEAAVRLIGGRLTPEYTPETVHVDGNVSLDDLRKVFPGF
jgi:NAD(P)H-dependent FMN reductase